MTLDPSPPSSRSATPRTPEEHVARWRRTGDVEALGALFDATAPVLHRIALATVGDAALAEDALQQTFLDALKKLDRYDPTRPVTPWLVGFLQRNARKARRRARRRPDPARLPSPAAAEPELDVEKARTAIDALDEPYRSVALLRWRYGLEPAAIAHVRDEPPGTTRSLLSRALERLRGALGALALLPLGAPRGLGAVRDAVIREAASRAAAGALAAGGVVVAKKSLVAAVGVAVLVVAGWVGWSALDRGSEESSGRGTVAGGTPTPAIATAPTLEGTPSGSGDAKYPSVVGPRITGRVLDAEGRPVPGATVGAAPDRDGASVPLDDAKGVRSEADGRFVLSVEPGTRYTVAAASVAGGDAVQAGVAAGDDVRLVLGAPASLAGQVVDLEARPIVGAVVEVRTWLDGAVVARTGTSGTDGRYRVGGLPARAPRPGIEAVAYAGAEVRATGYARVLLESRLPALRRGEEAHLDVVLGRGATLEGRVLEEDSERPVADARVVVWSLGGGGSLWRASGKAGRSPWRGEIVAETRSAEDGSFRIEHVPATGFHPAERMASGSRGPLQGTVGAQKAGFAFSTDEVPIVAEGAVVTAEVRLWPAATVSGRVLGEDGAPAADIEVWALAEGSWKRGAKSAPSSIPEAATSFARTDGEGRFRMTGVHASRAGSVRVEVQAHQRHWSEGVQGGAPRDAKVDVEVRPGDDLVVPDLRLSGPPLLRLRVHVVDEAGRAIPRALVLTVGAFARFTADDAGVAEATWPAEGNQAPRGDVQLKVDATGFGSEWTTVTPAPGPPRDVTVTLRPARPLVGRVVHADGRPAVGASVTVVGADVPVPEPGKPWRPLPNSRDWTWATAFSDETGAFEVRDLPAGPYRVGASFASGHYDGFYLTAPPVRAEAGEGVALVLSREPAWRGASVEGTVDAQETGRPVGIFTVSVRSGDEVRWADVPFPGRFRFEGVRAGPWTLEVHADGYVTDRRTIEVAEEPMAVPVTLSRGITVTGVVPAAHRDVLRDRKVSFLPVTGRVADEEWINASIAPDGSYRATGLKPGRYRVVAFSLRHLDPADPPYGEPAGAVLEVPEGEAELRHDPALAPAGTLSLTPADTRLPPQAYDGSRATEEQVRFGAASRIEVLGPGGERVAEVRGLRRGWLGAASWVVVPAATYRVVTTWPDGTTTEASYAVEIGKTINTR